MANFTPKPINLTAHGRRCIPETMLQHIDSGKPLYLVEPITDNRAFISIHKDPAGHICTYIAAADIIPDNVDPEPELTEKQIERIDEIYNAAFDFAKILTEKEDLAWNMSYIGEIADAATEIMKAHAFKIRFPYITYDDNGKASIEDFM